MHVLANAVQAAKVWGPPGRPAALGDLRAEGWLGLGSLHQLGVQTQGWGEGTTGMALDRRHQAPCSGALCSRMCTRLCRLGKKTGESALSRVWVSLNTVQVSVSYVVIY